MNQNAYGKYRFNIATALYNAGPDIILGVYYGLIINDMQYTEG